MAEVLPKDILLRCGGRTWLRHGVLAVAGARKGLVEVPVTFSRADATTCATYIDQDGILRLAAAGVPRIEYPPALSGLVDAFGYPYCGPSLEGSRPNSWLWSEDFTNGVWGSNGLASVTADATTAPDKTVTADKIVENAVNTSHIIFQSVAGGTDNTVQSNFFHVKAAERTWCVIRTLDKNNVAKFSFVNLATGAKGTIDAAHTITVIPLAFGFYRIIVAWNVGAGGTTPLVCAGASTGDGVAAYLGDGVSGIYVWGGQWEKDKAFAGSYVKTQGATITRAADSFTVPYNAGPFDMSVLARWARPVHADASGDIGIFPNLFTLGNRNGGAHESYFVKGSRGLTSEFWWTASLSTSKTFSSMPAGNEIAVSTQIKNIKTAPQVTLDPDGTGMLTFAGAGTAVTSWGAQTVTIGTSMFGVLFDLIFVRGLRTRAETMNIP